MRNVVPKRALSRRSRNFMLMGVVVGLIGLFIVTVSIFMRSVPLISRTNDSYNLYVLFRDIFLWLGITLGIAGVAMMIRAATWKQDNPLAKEVGDVLGKNLNERYVYIRNVSKFAIGYVDGVLVGPPGVLVFRVTNKEGTFFNEGNYWMRQQDKGDWKTMRWSPTKECADDIIKIREFLAARGVGQVPVFGVVVFTSDITTVSLEKPTLPVLQPWELEQGLNATYFANRDRIDQLIANKIADLLTG